MHGFFYPPCKGKSAKIEISLNVGELKARLCSTALFFIKLSEEFLTNTLVFKQLFSLHCQFWCILILIKISQLVAYLSSYHEKAINALYELA